MPTVDRSTCGCSACPPAPECPRESVPLLPPTLSLLPELTTSTGCCSHGLVRLSNDFFRPKFQIWCLRELFLSLGAVMASKERQLPLDYDEVADMNRLNLHLLAGSFIYWAVWRVPAEGLFPPKPCFSRCGTGRRSICLHRYSFYKNESLMILGIKTLVSY